MIDSIKKIGTSTPVLDSGKVIAQVVNFEETKSIHKVSVDLNLVNKEQTFYINEKDGIASFSACNWQDSRNSWVFQPKMHWDSPSWLTSGISISNIFQYDSYLDPKDAIDNSPLLIYSIFFTTSGFYNIWGYGYTPANFYWSFDSEDSLKTSSLGSSDTPEWTHIGSVFVPAAGVYKFKVALKENSSLIFDQWMFSTRTSFDGDLNTPTELSNAPFMTCIRLRPLTDGLLSDLKTITGTCAWLSSNNIRSSGKYNYEIRRQPLISGVDFNAGLSLEFFQIGGGPSFYVSWNYTIQTNSVGKAYISTNYGQDFYE